MLMFRAFLIFSLSLFLSACGGGGGDSATPTGSVVAISPDTASIGGGQSLPLRITGGIGPYRLVSSDPQVLPVPTVIDNLYAADVTVTAVDARQTKIVIITVTDNKGQSAKATVTVTGSDVAMALSPSALSLASTKTQVFNLVGGRAPFTVTTTRPDLLTLDTSGLRNKTFTALANTVLTQVSDIGLNVMDATGNIVSAKISVMPFQLFSSAQVDPSGASGGGDSTVGAVTAGQQGVLRIQTSEGYSVPRKLTIERVYGSFTLNMDAIDPLGRLQVEVGNDHKALATLTASPGAVTQTGKIRVTDNQTGIFIENGFQIAGLSLSAAPSTVTAISDSTVCRSGSVGTLQILGGVPPYTILSASPALVFATPETISQSRGSTTIMANGICTSTTGVILTVTDAVGVQTSIPFVSVAKPGAALSVLPASLSAAATNIVTLTIAGGTPPFAATSSNVALATVNAVSGNQVIVTANAAGTANILVSDALAQSASAVLTVTAKPGAALSVLPASLSAATTNIVTLTIAGGTPPFAATSSNVAIATVNAVAGNQVTVTAKAAGTADIVVSDASSQTVAAVLTVAAKPVGAALSVLPASLSAAATNIVTLTIAGGTPPFAATSSNVAIATVNAVAGNQVTVTAKAAGTADIVVTDSTSQTVSAVLTVK